MPSNPPLIPLKQLATPAGLTAPLWARALGPHGPTAGRFDRAAPRPTGVAHRAVPAAREHNRGRHSG